jgi:NADPH-dependent 2,4-dienoyl-CoA reductase/sulfur reductase-like enzyme
MQERFVIIGGDAAGMSAASKARRENPGLEIIVLEKGNWASYGACGLPYYIKGDIKNIQDLVAISPEIFREKRGIDLRLNQEAIRILPEDKELVVHTRAGDYNLGYDKLLISTGARAIKPKIPGIDANGIFTLRDMDSGKNIKEYLQKNLPESVLIVGGGYIGIEMAEAFHANGLKVYIVELLPHILNSFGTEITAVVENHLKNYAQLRLGKYVNTIIETDMGELSVQIKDKKATNYEENISTDMVLLATGITPEITIAEEAGITIGETGAIAVDEYGRTNIPGIYAAGDCAEAKHVVTGQPVYIPLALTANRNGRAIGSTIGGSATCLASITGTAVVKVFQLEVATTGIIDIELAEKNGFNPVKVAVDSHSRAGYCPKAKPIKISIIADKKSKRLLGASMAGEEGVVKRIDIIATALSGQFTVEQLENLDLAYAPPFSPVWDPVLTAAKVLNSKLDK